MMSTEEMITADLMRVLREIRGEDAAPPALDMKLIADLKMLSDEATEMAVMMQEITGIKPPLKEWRDVYTVRDVINLLLKYAPRD